MTTDKAKILDKILLKFNGNITVNWTDLQSNIWDDIASYNICENNINFLVGDQMLKRDTQLQTLSLTDKGFAVMTDINDLGYFKIAKKEKRETIFKYLSYFIGIATFVILFLKTFIWNFDKQNSSIKQTIIDSINNSSKVKTSENLGQTNRNNQPLQDTLPKTQKLDTTTKNTSK